MNEDISNKVVDNLTNDKSKELIELMKINNISDGIIMLTMLGIGSHTEYYVVLYNRLNNIKEKLTDDIVKKEVIDILHEIDNAEEE